MMMRVMMLFAENSHSDGYDDDDDDHHHDEDDAVRAWHIIPRMLHANQSGLLLPKTCAQGTEGIYITKGARTSSKFDNYASLSLEADISSRWGNIETRNIKSIFLEALTT